MMRFCVWLLETFLPPSVSDAVVGDLEEQRDRGGFWLLNETVSALWHLGVMPKPDGLMSAFLNDLRIAARLLRRAPTFTAAVVITLGLAIGATTAIFSIVEPVLLKPLPYPDAERLVMVWERERNGGRDNVGFQTYRDLAREATTLESASAVGDWQPTVAPSNGDAMERVQGQRVSWTYFRTLGVAPAIGRAFVKEEDTPDTYRVVILSHGLWQRAFGGDSSLVGKPISIGGTAMTVVGIMPASFDNVTQPDAQIWRVLGYDNQAWTCRTCHHLEMIARVKAGHTLTDAERELTGIHNRLKKEYPKEYGSVGAMVVGLQSDVTQQFRPALLAIAGAVILMLLIAAANVVNLNLARSARREQEFAVRTALGAGQSRLTAQLLAEGILLAVLGGIAGVLIARLALPLLVSRLPDQLPRLAAIHLDGGALALTAAVVLVLSAAVGLTAGGRGADNLAAALHGGRRVAGSARHLLRRSLVVAEVSLAVMLLASATLLGRSLVSLLAVDPGFDPERLLTLEINAVGIRYDTNANVYDYHQRVVDAVRAVPGVVDVAVANQIPLGGNVDMNGILDPENIPENPELAPSADRYSVSASYFKTMHLRLLRGRTFTEAEALDTANLVTLVSEGLAARLWPGQDPIGKRLRAGGLEGRDRRIIGMVANIKHRGLDANIPLQYYTPERQWYAGDPEILVVRAHDDPVALASAVRRAVSSVDASQPITKIFSMDQLIRTTTMQRRLALVLFGAFAIAALLLAVAGIYGVLAGNVTERTREIGVRSALGATPANILALIVSQGGRLAAFGIVIGVAGSLALTRFLESLLYGVKATDPVTLVAVSIALALITLAASLIPARRALRIDPAVALRAD